MSALVLTHLSEKANHPLLVGQMLRGTLAVQKYKPETNIQPPRKQ
jgi:hypothetical protein